MSKIGSKKEFPKLKRGVGIQFCIDGVLVHEVLKMLPKNIKIYGARVFLKEFGKGNKIVIQNALRRLGVTSIFERRSTKDVSITFDEVPREIIEHNTKKVCEMIGTNYLKAYFHTITLANKEASAQFSRTTKEIHPDETDLRKKLIVLGAIEGKGPVHNLFADIGAAEFECSVQEVTVRTAICKKK